MSLSCSLAASNSVGDVRVGRAGVWRGDSRALIGRPRPAGMSRFRSRLASLACPGPGFKLKFRGPSPRQTRSLKLSESHSGSESQAGWPGDACTQWHRWPGPTLAGTTRNAPPPSPGTGSLRVLAASWPSRNAPQRLGGLAWTLGAVASAGLDPAAQPSHTLTAPHLNRDIATYRIKPIDPRWA